MEESEYFKIKYDANQNIFEISASKGLIFSLYSGPEEYLMKYGYTLPHGDPKIGSRVAFENQRSTTLDERFSAFCAKSKVLEEEVSSSPSKYRSEIYLEAGCRRAVFKKKFPSIDKASAEYGSVLRVMQSRIKLDNPGSPEERSKIVKSKRKKRVKEKNSTSLWRKCVERNWCKRLKSDLKSAPFFKDSADIKELLANKSPDQQRVMKSFIKEQLDKELDSYMSG